MKCPYCGYIESKVIDSRPSQDYSSIRRRRECLECKKRFTTYEKLETVAMLVIKRDLSRQEYDRNKVLKGIMTACEKRPVTLAQMEEIADKIELELYRNADREVETRVIGEKVMEKLRNLDAVAYVRFASVYKQFDDIETFMKELEGMKEGMKHE